MKSLFSNLTYSWEQGEKKLKMEAYLRAIVDGVMSKAPPQIKKEIEDNLGGMDNFKGVVSALGMVEICRHLDDNPERQL